jgi:hypothetical protein
LNGLKLKQNYSRKYFQNTSGEKMKIRNVARLTVIAVIVVAIMFAGCIEERSQDSDGDGWTDDQEKLMQTDPHKIDTDGDKIKDSEDPNPLVADPALISQDSDGDGWTDYQEKLMQTDPHKIDTDGDRIKDSEDPNPLVADPALITLGYTKTNSELSFGEMGYFSVSDVELINYGGTSGKATVTITGDDSGASTSFTINVPPHNSVIQRDAICDITGNDMFVDITLVVGGKTEKTIQHRLK